MSESDSILHEQVAKLAYEIWESKGRPAGTAEIDWLEAEEFLEFGDPEKPPFQSIAALSGAEAQPGSETSYMHLTEEGAKQHPTSELKATRGLNI